MRSRSMPTDSQSPPGPPAIPRRLLRTPSDDIRNPGLEMRVDSLKNEVASIVKNTEWPRESRAAAESLLNTISSSPNISDNMIRTTRELKNLVERYIQILDDVCLRLKEAASKSEKKRWKFLQRMKSLDSSRPSKCTLLFQTCQDDVSQVINALNENVDHEWANEQERVEIPLSSPQAQLHSAAQSQAQELPTGTTEHRLASDDSTLNSKQPESNPLRDSKYRGPISEEALKIARRTLKSVEIGSGAIPVVGSYVGAAAKVGLAFVEMLQTMDRNDSMAVDLGDHTSRLTKILGSFKEKSSMDEQNLADQINNLHRELVRVKEKVEEGNSLGKFRKAFSARDQAEKLREYQGTVQTAREEMQLLVSLGSRNMIIELENIELRKERRRLLKCLGDGQYGARGNTIENIICFPGTRMEILKRIDVWIRDTSLPNPVLWISGMAGQGKSTIASTVVHNWKCRASCAIFHFRRGQSTVNSRVICVVARQLGSSLVSEVKDAILESVRENEDIAGPGRRLDEQFETLLVAPFAKLECQTHPILIVVDALDECDNPNDAVDLVRLIHKYSSSFPKNVKFLLTCRPEATILRNLQSKQWYKEDLDSAPDVDNDLARFIQHSCTHIRHDHDLSADWPSAGDVEQLVQMSQGLFQWARTATTYLGEGSPVDRLRVLLERPAMWSGLDDLYHQILSKAFIAVRLDRVRRDLLHHVVGTVALAPYPLSLEVIASLYSRHPMFNGMNQEDIIQFLRKDILADLNSLLFIPPSPTEPMRLMHTSIRDLLVSADRCEQQPYYINLIRHHQRVTSACFEIMLGHLKENICNLSDPSKPISEVHDITEREVSTAVRYCCLAWSIHLTEGITWSNNGENGASIELGDFEIFSKEKILCWVEVMSLVGATADAIIAAKRVHNGFW
ncbi:hypothetical protein M407DRAFT_31956 [Tulasnella calospora MUT 4182]|uniref:NACHT domain-containing protein n=1 Tax=Tulasnella calospora MUT 4182 TaxID=1051891 RepID=A0A0C3Q5L4_9AGAM|nr:hypothetical protein M407DRAFT_31956 [Tulasnella calospora MUT 4182]